MSLQIDTVIRKAYAKVNLALDVTGKREDGYHLVRLTLHTVDVSDLLVFRKNGSGEITLSVEPGSIVPDDFPAGPDNLVCRAAERIRETFGIREGVDISLTKTIPAAAGMAGGSTDAAAVFHAFNTMFGLGLSLEELQEMALPLGADIPFCIRGGAALAEGIGEKLTDLPAMPPCSLLLAKPPVSVSTGEVFRALDGEKAPVHPDVPGLVDAFGRSDLTEIAGKCGNILEPVTVRKAGIIRLIEEKMTEAGALCSHMTGSGPTVYGIFENAAAAESAEKMLKEDDRFAGCRIIRTGFRKQ